MNDDIKLSDVRPEVAAFAIAMERELRANDHKGTWKHDEPKELLLRAYEEMGEFHAVLRDDTLPQIAWHRRVLSEAADTANFMMMVCDVRGVLSIGVDPAPDRPACPHGHGPMQPLDIEMHPEQRVWQCATCRYEVFRG